MNRVFEFKITDEYSGMTVSDILRGRYEMSGSLIKDLKKYADGLLLNNEHIRTVDTVKPGDILRITMHDKSSETIEPEDMKLDIVYEDEDILIINKPSGIPTHPSQGHFTGTLANGVAAHYIKNGEEHTFRAVNRLDKDTSGLMCVAKNSYSHARLVSGIKNSSLRRKYRAIVIGTPDDCGVIDAPIDREDGLKRCVADTGKNAVTHYRLLESHGGYSLVELELETGRTHQIRVHMAYIGHPLLGDWLYGKEDKELFLRQALHSSYLELIHPVTFEKLCFCAELPDDMREFLIKTE